jgi:hypothetical protein
MEEEIIVPMFIRDWLLNEDNYILKEVDTGEEKSVVGKDLYDNYDDESIYKAWNYNKPLVNNSKKYLLLDAVA